MENNNLISLGIGEKVLNKDNLTKSRVKILNDIIDVIENLKKSSKINASTNRGYNNFISILGTRGSGKSSMIITLLNELNDRANTDMNNYKYKVKQDIIFDKIDPLMFSLEKNALGWIISMFEDSVNSLYSYKSNYYCNVKNNFVDKVEESYKLLSKDYIISRDFYRSNLHALSEGINEYKKVNEEIIKSDKRLNESFSSFIDNFVCALKQINSSNNETNGKQREPYIIISFDDIDIRPQYGPEILDTIIKYLSHKNIIVLISGDYNTFKESLFLDILRKEDLPADIKLDTVLIEKPLKEEILQRTDDILNKVIPPTYRYYLEGLSIPERLAYTPYGYYGKSIGCLLSQLEIDSRFNSDNAAETCILDYFFTPNINTSILESAITKLDETEKKRYDDKSFRGYDGYRFDRRYYEENVLSIKAQKKLVELYKKEMIYGEYEYRGNNNEFNSDERERLSEISYTDLGELLPDTPRGLINLYHSLNLFLDEIGDKDKSEGHETRGFGFRRKTHIENFNSLVKILNIFKQANVHLNYVESKEIIDSVIEIDEEYKTITFDFSCIIIDSKEFYHSKVINITNTITFYKENEKGKNNRILNEIARFLQFAYDLSKRYLLKEYIIVKKDKNLSGITVYNRFDDNIRIETEDFNTFRDFYIFQAMYKISIPVIIQDLKVHRNIRERLRLYLYNIMFSTVNKRVDEDKLYYIYNKLPKLRDINNGKSREKYVDEYLALYENYYERYFIHSREFQNKKYTVSEYILYYKENNQFVVDIKNDFIKNNEILLLYNDICLNLTSNKSYRARTYDLYEILNSAEIEFTNSIEYALKENINKLVKEIEKQKDNDKISEVLDNEWNSIANYIASLMLTLIANLIVLNYETKNENNFEIIDTENKDLLLKLKKVNSNKISKDFFASIYKELTGLDINNQSIEIIDILKICEYIIRHDYYCMDRRDTIRLYLRELNMNTTGKNNIKKHLEIIKEALENAKNYCFDSEKIIKRLQKDQEDIEKIIYIADCYPSKGFNGKFAKIVDAYCKDTETLNALHEKVASKNDESNGNENE